MKNLNDLIVGDAFADGVGIAPLPEWSRRELPERGRIVRIVSEWGRAVPDLLAEARHPKAAASEAVL